MIKDPLSKLEHDHPGIRRVFERFKENDYEIYVVGGAVRDVLLGRDVHDIDFATNARPDQTQALFKKSVPLGARFGSVQVIEEGEAFDITTYRSESGYSDGRHPDNLSFGDNLEEDLIRRDFTVNSLALGPDGEITDLFGGIPDLKNNMIRAVGDPRERFREDALRKWRCIRFATQKDFQIDPGTFRALTEDPDTSQVSIERITTELTDILLSDNVGPGGNYLVRSGLYPALLRRLFPESEEEPVALTELTASFGRASKVPKDLSLRLTALLYGLPDERAEEFLKRMRFPQKTTGEVLAYLKALSVGPEDGIIPVKKAAALIGRENLKNLVSLKKGIALADQDNRALKSANRLGEIVERILTQNHPLLRAELALNGNDLRELGYIGKQMRRVFDFLLEAVYTDPKKNDRETLIELLKSKGEPS